MTGGPSDTSAFRLWVLRGYLSWFLNRQTGTPTDGLVAPQVGRYLHRWAGSSTDGPVPDLVPPGSSGTRPGTFTVGPVPGIVPQQMGWPCTLTNVLVPPQMHRYLEWGCCLPWYFHRLAGTWPGTSTAALFSPLMARYLELD